MFGFKKKKEVVYPINMPLGNLSVNQRMSVLNFLNFLAISDGALKPNEVRFLNDIQVSLNVSLGACKEYLDLYGIDRMQLDLKNLRNLEQSTKDYLLFTAWELINCDGNRTNEEMTFLIELSENMGYEDAHKAIAAIQKMILFVKQFG